MPANLDTQVRTLLEQRRGDWLTLAKAAEVSHSWISKFVNGRIPNPGYATLVRLHECLTSKRATKKAAAAEVTHG